MRVTIEGLNSDLPSVEALLMRPHHMSIPDGMVNSGNVMVTKIIPPDIDLQVNCDGIVVNDDRISIAFPDGSIADYEITTGDYHRIVII